MSRAIDELDIHGFLNLEKSGRKKHIHLLKIYGLADQEHFECFRKYSVVVHNAVF